MADTVKISGLRNEDFARFDDAMGRILAVPKAEIERREAEAKKAKPEKKRKEG